MRRKLRLVKGAAQRGTLIYGMRMLAEGSLLSIDPAIIHLNEGASARVTMHAIEGTRTQIRRQLLRSIDAFFELIEDEA
jgi:hypothetical protein